VRCSKELFFERRGKKKSSGRLLSRTSSQSVQGKNEEGTRHRQRCHHHNASDLVKGGQGWLLQVGGGKPTRAPVTNDLLESREGLREGVRSEM